jgi:hypothetical protein
MPWMDVKIVVAEINGIVAHTVDSVVNIENISRIGRLSTGCYIMTVDGESLEVTDSYEEVVRVCLQADAKTP